MLIYGNTPADIRKKIMQSKWKIFSFLMLFAVVFLVLSCSGSRNSDNQLKALDKFWKALGGENSIEKVE
jgi:hypothetical protein